MILDTNAVSAWADGDPALEPVLRAAGRVMVPVIVIGEFEYGIRQSRHYARYASWLDANLGHVEIMPITRDVAVAYGLVRVELRNAGTPIPINDAWIAAIARVAMQPVISRDRHFDAVAEVQRVAW